jgi:hypothetical protein
VEDILPTQQPCSTTPVCQARHLPQTALRLPSIRKVDQMPSGVRLPTPKQLVDKAPSCMLSWQRRSTENVRENVDMHMSLTSQAGLIPCPLCYNCYIPTCVMPMSMNTQRASQPWSKSWPKGEELRVRRACFPSMQSCTGGGDAAVTCVHVLLCHCPHARHGQTCRWAMHRWLS